MSTQPKQPPGVKMLVEWEGQAVHHPGVLFEETYADHMSTVEDPAVIAGWIAVTAISRPIGDSADDPIRRKVVAFLKNWRARFGQEKVDQVKNQLYTEMEKYRKDRKMSEQEVRQRIQGLFDEING